MKKYLKELPEELKKILRQAAKISCETKMPAYLVGGCLRDLVLEVKNFDLDIAVEGDGILFAGRLAEKLKSGLIIHQRFRTATLTLNNELKVDIATARQEKYPSSAALPVVSPGSLREDLKRRDFTINAMALNIVVDKKQKIIDPFDAQADLALGRIRILHNLSFRDDPTRILRAIRFSQRFDFKIEPNTLQLLKEAISDGLLDKVNHHRLRDELIAMLKEQNPFRPIKQANDLGALSFISTRLKVGKLTQDLFRSIAKEISRFKKNFPTRRKLDAWLVYFTALLGPLTRLEIKMIIHRLGLRKGEEKRVIGYYQQRGKLNSCLGKNKLLPEQVFALLEPLSYETLILLSAASGNKNLKKYLADFLQIYNGVRLCVSGNDLDNLGVFPGPEYQRIFAKVLADKLNGRVGGRQTELALIRKLVKDK